ncbi:protein of unknown function (plasmid) [Caballeronia sp. S22]
MFGREHVREADAEKEPHTPDAMPLFDERAHQRDGFGVGLAPHDGIAGADQRGEIHVGV